MADKEKLFQRVKEGAAEIAGLAAGGSNVPLENFIDRTGLDSLCHTLAMVDKWQREDFERILVIREGLMDLRDRLRDNNDESEHSAEQLLRLLDRLYADFDRALQETEKDALADARKHLEGMRSGRSISLKKNGEALSEIKSEATELLTNVGITESSIQFNLVQIDRLSINPEILKSAQLMVRRLSANVFAIKLSLDQNTIYQAVFKFLADGADKLLKQIREVAGTLKDAYSKATDFVEDLSVLAQSGTKFTRHLVNVIAELFSEDSQQSKTVKITLQTALQSQMILSGARTTHNVILFGGKDSIVRAVDAATGALLNETPIKRGYVHSMAHFDDRILIGTDHGVLTVESGGQITPGGYQTSYNDRVIAVVAPTWGVVTAARDGTLRVFGRNAGTQQEFEKIARRIQRMILREDELIVAAGHDIMIVQKEFKERIRLTLDFEITDFVLFDKETLVAVGTGKIAVVNLEQGIFANVITASELMDYVSVIPLNSDFYCVGSASGHVSVMSIKNGAEVGRTNVAYEIAGMVATPTKLFVYGGEWQKRGRSVSIFLWEEFVEK